MEHVHLFDRPAELRKGVPSPKEGVRHRDVRDRQRDGSAPEASARSQRAAGLEAIRAKRRRERSARSARRDAEDKFRVALSHVVILVVVARGNVEPVARVKLEPHLTFRIRHMDVERT